MIQGAKKIIGKTIAGIVVKRSDDHPKSQIFLIFSDNTSYEFYSDYPKLKGTTNLSSYGIDGVRKFMSKTHEIVFEFYDETVKDISRNASDSNKRD